MSAIHHLRIDDPNMSEQSITFYGGVRMQLLAFNY